MSLYSSITVPAEDKKPVKKPGFTGLYEDSPTVIEAAPFLYSDQNVETGSSARHESKPNAGTYIPPNDFLEQSLNSQHYNLHHRNVARYRSSNPG